MAYYLSVDYGGTNTKTIIFDDKGNEISVSSFQTMRKEEKAGYREVDLAETTAAIYDSIKKALVKANLTGEDISAIACVGHGKGLYVLDKNHKEFTNGILSTDSRANDLAKKFENKIKDLWTKTRQHVFSVQNPILLHWLKKNKPEIYGNIGAILSAKDFIRFKLTNKVNQEYGDASGNHWINFNTGTYDDGILDFFEISEMKEALPPLVDYKEIAGNVTAEVAKKTGLKEGTPVVGGLFDIDACAIGSGVLESDTFSVIAGTWNINTYPSKTPAEYENGQMTSYFPTRDYLIEESSPTSAGNLDIILKTLMAEEMSNLAETESIYTGLEIFLKDTNASFSKVIFFPFLYGSNAHPDAQSCFLGMDSTTTKLEMIRAVYEGIAFAHKQHIDKLKKSAGQIPKVIRLSGGATNSQEWCQIFADILNIPIETLECSELGGLGGAIACEQAINGKTLEEAVKRMVRVKKRFEPNKNENQKYNLKYEVYEKLLKSLENSWTDLKKLNEIL